MSFFKNLENHTVLLAVVAQNKSALKIQSAYAFFDNTESFRLRNTNLFTNLIQERCRALLLNLGGFHSNSNFSFFPFRCYVFKVFFWICHFSLSFYVWRYRLKNRSPQCLFLFHLIQTDHFLFMACKLRPLLEKVNEKC